MHIYMKRISFLILTIAVAMIGLPSTGIGCDTPRSTNSAWAAGLTEYVVSSYGGYGLYLRSKPRDGATTKTVYREPKFALTVGGGFAYCIAQRKPGFELLLGVNVRRSQFQAGYDFVNMTPRIGWQYQIIRN